MTRLRLSILGLGIGGIGAAWLALAAACLLPEAGLVDARGSGGSGGGAGGGGGAAAVTDLVVGWTTSCGVASGAAYCWGENVWGAVGSGDELTAWSATRVKGLGAPVEQLVAGYQFFCARLADASVACWGRNGAGAFGTLGAEANPSPVPVPDFADAVALGAGFEFLCARRTDGTVACMGEGAFGSLGAPIPGATEPVVIDLAGPGLGAATELVTSAASSVACALDAARQLVCWGAGTLPTRLSSEPVLAAAVGVGEHLPDDPLADEKLVYTTASGTFYRRPEAGSWSAPIDLGIVAGVEGITIGAFRYCVWLGDGSVLCGDYDATNGQPTAATGLDLLDAYPSRKVGMGLGFGCALGTDDLVRCWGQNGMGQVGNDRPGEVYAPSDVAGVQNATRVFVGAHATAALVGTGTTAHLRAWGDSSAFGVARSLPSDVGTPGAAWLSFDATSTEDTYATVLMSDGTLRYYENAVATSSIRLTATGEGLTHVFGARGLFDVALSGQPASEVTFYVDDGNMATLGLLGNNSTAPVGANAGYYLDVPGVAVDLARGYGAEHLCVRAGAAGTDVYCWGRNDHGQVGYGVGGNVLVPTFALAGATSLCAGQQHTCAVAAGDVSCWGDDSAGQLGVLGVADQGAPELVTALPEPVDVVACGAAHTCAYQVGPAGKLWCWGFNATGALGVGDEDWHELPTQVPHTGLVDLSAGIYHTCAVTTDGRVRCWGAADYGQVGNGTTTVDYPAAEEVVGIGG